MSNIAASLYRKIKSFLPFSRTVGFIVCGTQKGGTTALDTYLREHPEICMACKKELHFFDNDKYFANGQPDYSRYHAYFSPRKRHKILGEVTPSYMYWLKSPKRIFEYNPEMRLIVILRNPIERAYSHWNMEHLENKDNLSFADAIRTEKQRCHGTEPYQHKVFSYIDRGHYLEQLRRIWEFFPKERVLVLKNDHLKQYPLETLNQVTDFLEISQYKHIETKDVHSRPYSSEMSQEEKDILESIFAPEIKELEAELQWDCSDWIK